MIAKDKLNDAVICKEKDSILEVSRILRDTGRRHLIVVNDALEPLGIISTVDINNRVVAEVKDPANSLALDFMTKPIEVVSIETSYEEAYEKMISKGTYSIPVVEEGKLIGVLDFNRLFGKAKEAKNEEH